MRLTICSGLNIPAELDYAIIRYKNGIPQQIVAASYFGRSNVVKSVTSGLLNTSSDSEGVVIMREENRYTGRGFSGKNTRYKVKSEKLSFDMDSVVHTTVVASDYGEDYIVTDNAHLEEDVYGYLRRRYRTPILQEWMPAIVNKMRRYDCINVQEYENNSSNDSRRTHYIAGNVFYSGDNRAININGHSINFDDIRVVNFSMDEHRYRWLIEKLLREGAIRVANTPERQRFLNFADMSGYVSKFGPDMVKRLDDYVKPRIPVTGYLPEIAFASKALKAPQAAMVAGFLKIFEEGERYGLMVAEMGCGKTLMSIATVFGYYIRQWLRMHPGATIREAYEALIRGEISYRVVVMCPSQLTRKWKKEIESEITGARVQIITSIDDLMALRARGSERNGQEWYIISKDRAKLGETYAPTPTRYSSRRVKVQVCADCNSETRPYADRRLVYKTAPNMKCPSCGGDAWIKVNRGSEMHDGMVCPCCGELLIDYRKIDEGDFEKGVLQPKDFSRQWDKNRFCYHCGQSLWAPVTPNAESKRHHWKKFRHYATNSRRGDKVLDFALMGYEREHFELTAGSVDADRKPRTFPMGEGDISFEPIRAPRRTSPAKFIHTHMQNFFDFCILDEFHLYAGKDTAQSNAAHYLVKASKKTLALTGTLMNGKASSLFYLMQMLDPALMKKNGFGYNDLSKFTDCFGSREYNFSLTEEDYEAYRNGSKKNVSRKAGKEIPGISPVVYSQILINHMLTLGITDFSDELPPYREEVISVPLEAPLQEVYDTTLNQFLSVMRHEGNGGKTFGTYLNYMLNITDKHYNREPIVDPVTGEVLFSIQDPGLSENYLTNKERALADLVNRELNEGRNCFIFASFTGHGEAYIMGRLKWVLKSACGLMGKSVQIIESNTVSAERRMDWIAKQAAENDTKVFICNPTLVETGVDLIWTGEDGKVYNYPTLIFYQTGLRLPTVWQASRRSYRLIQTEECRTYYLVSAGTAQEMVVNLMGEKRAATAAIQGDLTQGTLNAGHEDTRIALARGLMNGDVTDVDAVNSRFAAINSHRTGPSMYAGFQRNPLWSDIIGTEEEAETVSGLEQIEAGIEAPVREEVIVVEPDIFDIMTDMGEEVTVNFEPESLKRVRKHRKVTRKSTTSTTLSVDFSQFFSI